MTDYSQIQQICEANGRMSASTVDDYLVYYAADQNKLATEMDDRLTPFKHVTRKLDQAWVKLFKSQYIAHRIFRKDGLIHKYLNHSLIKLLKDKQYHYLEQQAKTPWRFSFSTQNGNPAPDFYEMTDVFTGDEFLLYSKGVTQVNEQETPLMWFNLIGFNGSCYQSFGPILHFRSFEPDDIFFFATELHPAIETDEDLVRDVEENPVPYMMLVCGSAYPITVHKNVKASYNKSVYLRDTFDPEGLKDDFVITQSGPVMRAQPKKWMDYPHFATLYFDEKEKIVQLSSMSDESYEALIHSLRAHGYEFDEDPDFRISPSMFVTTKEILNEKLSFDDYAPLFEIPTSSETKKEIDALNALVPLLLPAINAGKTPDYQAVASQTGVDIETIRDLGRQMTEAFSKGQKG